MHWERDGDGRDKDIEMEMEMEIDILVNKIKWMEHFLNKYKFNVNLKVCSLWSAFAHTLNSH